MGPQEDIHLLADADAHGLGTSRSNLREGVYGTSRGVVKPRRTRPAGRPFVLDLPRFSLMVVLSRGSRAASEPSQGPRRRREPLGPAERAEDPPLTPSPQARH